METDEIGAPKEILVCAACGTVLDYVVDQGWKHPAWMTEDHPAVPTPEGTVETQGMCDFCFAPQPRWQLPVRSFPTPAPGFGSAGNWAACEHCAHLIRLRQWQELTARAIKSWETRHGPMVPVMRGEIRRLYRLVREHQAGELTRL